MAKSLNKWQVIATGVVRHSTPAKSADKGVVRYSAVELMNTSIASKEVRKPINVGGYTEDKKGQHVFIMWREAVLSHRSGLLIPAPTKVIMAQALMLLRSFKEFFPEEELPLFFEALVKRWGECCAWLKLNTTLFNFDKYPNIPWMVKNIAHVLTWYNTLKIGKTPDSNSNEKKNTLQTQQVSVKLKATVNKTEGNSAGYTYIGNLRYDHIGQDNPTYEDKWVEMANSGAMNELEKLKKVLKKHAVDYAVSEARVMSLLKVGK